MRIVVTAGRRECCLEYHSDWYQVETESELALALSVLPVKINNEYESVEQTVCKGVASLRHSDYDTVEIEFRDYVSDTPGKVIRLPIDETCLSSVDWLYPPYTDKWMGCANVITLDNVGSYSIVAFIPEQDGAEDKTITFNNITTGEVKHQVLQRGHENIIDLIDSQSACKQTLKFECKPEPNANSPDTRDLGFLLVKEMVSSV